MRDSVAAETHSANPSSRNSTESSLGAQQVPLPFVLGLCALLGFGPLAYGAVEEWSTFTLEVGTAVLFCSYVIVRIVQDRFEFDLHPLYLPVAAFAALTGAQALLGLTAYRYATEAALVQYSAYGGILAFVMQAMRSERALRWFSRIMSVYGGLVAIFAIVQHATWNGKVYWVHTPKYPVLSWVYGPYINHNHYAGLMELLIPMALMLSISSKVAPAGRVVYATFSVVMASSIFLSLSRGGMIAFSAELLFLTVLLVLNHQKNAALMFSGLALAIIIFLYWSAGDTVMHRLMTIKAANADLSFTERLAIARDTLRMWRQHPWIGFGLGTYASVFGHYRSYYSNLLVLQAHDDYLQVLAETGVLGLLAVVWFAATVFYYGLKNRFLRAPSPMSSVSLGALAGCAGMLVHSTMDFNFQIPANAILFVVLAGVAVIHDDTSPCSIVGNVPRSLRFPARMLISSAEVPWMPGEGNRPE